MTQQELITLREFFEARFQDQDKVTAERNKALDERFESQERAVAFALAEREKAVNAALIAAKDAVAKAELNSNEAVGRIENAIDRITEVQARIVGSIMLLAVLFPALTGGIFYILTNHK